MWFLLEGPLKRSQTGWDPSSKTHWRPSSRPGTPEAVRDDPRRLARGHAATAFQRRQSTRSIKHECLRPDQTDDRILDRGSDQHPPTIRVNVKRADQPRLHQDKGRREKLSNAPISRRARRTFFTVRRHGPRISRSFYAGPAQLCRTSAASGRFASPQSSLPKSTGRNPCSRSMYGLQSQ